MPRWLIAVLVVILLIWLFVNPKGLAEFVTTVGSNVGTFFKNLG